MATVIDSGTDRNLTSTTDGQHLQVNPAEQRFVTFTNELGAVHTIVVDAEHIAKDAESLLRWFQHTSATVTHKSGTQEQPSHITPGEVLRLADEFLQNVGGAKERPQSEQSTGDVGGA